MTGNARAKLYYEMKHFTETLEQQKQEYIKKASVFLDGLKRIKKTTTDKVYAAKQGDVIYMNAVERFIMSDVAVLAEDLHILFARFCGFEQVNMMRVIIKSKNMKKKERIINRYDENGIPILEQHRVTADNTEFSHPWLILDDMLSIDLFRGNLNMFLDPKKQTEPDILLFRSKPYFKNDDWDGCRKILENRGYICEGPQFRNIDQNQLEAIYKQDDRLLETVYNALMMVIQGDAEYATITNEENSS